MAKNRSEYACRECGFRTQRPMGRCPECEAWGTFDPVSQPAAITSGGRSFGAPAAKLSRLHDIQVEGFERIDVPTREFARVLGGGIVRGSLVLIGGDPGVGKSTLLTQIAAQVSVANGPVLYISGEESLSQVGLRVRRMGLDTSDLLFASETDVDAVVQGIEQGGASLAVVDSIQSMMAVDVESVPGSVAQVRECTLRLMRMAKGAGVSIFLIGHVTKEGAIAGPKVLEHMVDTVLYLEGERFNSYRLLRSTKNRFGPTHEVGVFEMREEGLVEVPNPSALFLAERGESAPGSVVTVTLEGTRPILVEVQALASRSPLSVPRRTANGFDVSRLHLLTAVIARRLGKPLHDQDVYLNVVGGLRITETAADLAASLAIVSSLADHSLPNDIVVVGEVGLSGELRSVGQVETRLREAGNLGFTRALVPPSPGRRLAKDLGIEVLTVSTLREAARVLGM